jgi:hypothetical protein
MSAPKKLSAEEAWEEAGYRVARDEATGTNDAREAVLNAHYAVLAAYERGRARWEAAHGEVRA